MGFLDNFKADVAKMQKRPKKRKQKKKQIVKNVTVWPTRFAPVNRNTLSQMEK